MKDNAQGTAPGIVAPDLEAIKDFISTAVHDLREPLRAIRLGAHLLAADGGSPSAENAARGTRYVVEGVDRMEMLIRDIAEYCYEEVRTPVSEEIDMEMVLLEARNGLAGEIKGCGAVITHDPLPVVMGNFGSLATAMRCLIANACKFRGEAPLAVHIGAMREGNNWIFSVKDNGLGFDPAYKERIFRPFERLNGKQFPGSGLGSTLAKKIIEQHGGDIWADSHPGQGATISFRLPQADS
jgi:light-regulated signal transduction histidine kinase (bacteriophytochrome)